MAPSSGKGGAAAGGSAAVVRWRDLLAAILGVILLATFLKMCVVGAVRVPSSSMEETLVPGDFVLVSKMGFGVTLPICFPPISPVPAWFHVPAILSPRIGDVVVVRVDGEMAARWGLPPGLFIKRCVATAGDTLQLIGDQVIVNGRTLEIPSPRVAGRGGRDAADERRYGPAVVPGGRSFLVGDNMDASIDSRVFGAVPNNAIIGRATVIYWSLGDEPESAVEHPRRIRWNRIGMLVR